MNCGGTPSIFTIQIFAVLLCILGHGVRWLAKARSFFTKCGRYHFGRSTLWSLHCVQHSIKGASTAHWGTISSLLGWPIYLTLISPLYPLESTSSYLAMSYPSRTTSSPFPPGPYSSTGHVVVRSVAVRSFATPLCMPPSFLLSRTVKIICRFRSAGMLLTLALRKTDRCAHSFIVAVHCPYPVLGFVGKDARHAPSHTTYRRSSPTTSHACGSSFISLLFNTVLLLRSRHPIQCYPPRFLLVLPLSKRAR